MSKRFVTGLVLSLALAAPAAAQQRPLVTEDPETIGSGLILFEGGFDLGQEIFYPVSGLQGDLLRLPTLGLSFGLSSIAELQIDGGFYNRLKVTERIPAPLSGMLDFTGDTTSDVEDIVVATKVRLLSETAGRPAIGVRFATKLPNASNENGIGLDTTDFYATLLIGKTVQSVRLVGNAGLGILGDPTRGDRQGDVLQYRLLGRARRAAGRRDRRRDQRTPAAAGRRDRPAGNRHPRGHARRRPLHASHRAIRRRHHPRHDVAGSELRLHRRVDLGLPRIHVFPDRQKGEGRRENRFSLLPSPLTLSPMHLIKSHAFGNDFLLVDEREIAAVADIPALARAVCERHRGIGADGLLIFGDGAGGTTMRLLNADGSASEISGNGLRCLAAWLAHRDGGRDIEVTTGAGLKRLQLLDRSGSRYTFRAAMGQPEELTQESIAVGGTTVTAVTLRVGNPQCVVLGEVTTERLHSLAAALARASAISRRHERRAGDRGGAGPGAHSHLGARRRPDGSVRHRRVRRGRRRHGLRWRRASGRRDLAGRLAARRMARGWALPHRLGGTGRRGPMAGWRGGSVEACWWQ